MAYGNNEDGSLVDLSQDLAPGASAAAKKKGGGKGLLMLFLLLLCAAAAVGGAWMGYYEIPYVSPYIDAFKKGMTPGPAAAAPEAAVGAPDPAQEPAGPEKRGLQAAEARSLSAPGGGPPGAVGASPAKRARPGRRKPRPGTDLSGDGDYFADPLGLQLESEKAPKIKPRAAESPEAGAEEATPGLRPRKGRKSEPELSVDELLERGEEE